MCVAPRSSKRKPTLFGKRLNQRTVCELGSDTATLDRYEPQLGGAVELSVTLDDGVHRFGGAITRFEPGHRLTFSDSWFDHLAWPEPTFISFVLHAQSEATLVELYHHGFEVLGDIASKECLAYEQGRDATHLQHLKSLIESG